MKDLKVPLGDEIQAPIADDAGGLPPEPEQLALPKLTREQILAAPDLKEEDCPVAEWGGTVRLRALTLAQRNRILELATRNGEVDSTRAECLLFIEGVIEPRFTMADYEALRGKHAGAVERVALRVGALSGISRRALEDAIKNSNPTPNGASVSS